MIYAYIFVMAGVTYLIRMLPLTLIREKFRIFIYVLFYIIFLTHVLPL